MNETTSARRQFDTTERRLRDFDRIENTVGDRPLPDLSRVSNEEFNEFLDEALGPDQRGRFLH